MDKSQQKREKIFKDYKESIRRAKFAPLSKYALNIGNPHDVNEKLVDNAQINQNIDAVFYDYKIKLLEVKIRKLTMFSAVSFVISLISILIIIYKVG